MKKILVVWYKNFEYLDSIKNAFMENGLYADKFIIEYFSDKASLFERILNYLGIKYFVKLHAQKMRNELIEKCEKENFEDILIINGNFTNVLDEAFFLWATQTNRRLQLWFVDSVRGSKCYEKNFFMYFDKIYSFEPLDRQYLLEKYKVRDVGYLPLVAAREVYNDSSLDNKCYDVCFVGVGSEKRAEILEEVAKYCYLNNKKMIVCGQFWKFKPFIHRIRHECKFRKRYPYLYKFVINKFMKPADVAQIYRRSRVCLNISHSVHATYEAVNPRTFEIMATKSFQLADYSPSIEKNFLNGEHLVMYKDKEELIRLIDFYLKNDAAREKVAKQGFLEIKTNFLLSELVKVIIADSHSSLAN